MEIGQVSDGYHTFNELYEHRCLLFIAWMISDGCPGLAFYVPDHFDEWDLIACNIPHVGQISYHVKSAYRKLYEGQIAKRDSNDDYDGHSSRDVVKRITQWIEEG